MVPIDSSLKHASTSILLCQIIWSFAKDTSVFKNCKNRNLFLQLFYTADFRVELAESMRSSHGKYDLICWHAESRLTPNFWSEIFVEKLNILSRSGFSWLGTLVQTVGNALGDVPSSFWGWTEFSEIRLIGFGFELKRSICQTLLFRVFGNRNLKGLNNIDIKFY